MFTGAEHADVHNDPAVLAQRHGDLAVHEHVEKVGLVPLGKYWLVDGKVDLLSCVS